MKESLGGIYVAFLAIFFRKIFRKILRMSPSEISEGISDTTPEECVQMNPQTIFEEVLQQNSLEIFG